MILRLRREFQCILWGIRVMRYVSIALFLCSASAYAAHKPAPSDRSVVSQCFKVRRLLKTDDTHYWADWSNTCPFTIEAVYVMVGFLDGSHREMGNGVWPMYFVKPGAHRVTRFSAPVAGFETIRVHRITTDSAAALGADEMAIEVIRKQTLPPGTVGDSGYGKVLPDTPETSGNKTRY